MGLGNNRDYVTSERVVRRALSVINARVQELLAQGVPNASQQASQEFKAGQLLPQLKAWKDPILEHKRAMRKKNA